MRTLEKMRLPLQDTVGNQPSREYGTMMAVQDATYSNVCVFLPSCPYPFDYAQQIITAVNSFEAMREALFQCMEVLAYPRTLEAKTGRTAKDVYEQAEAALKLAEGSR